MKPEQWDDIDRGLAAATGLDVEQLLDDYLIVRAPADTWPRLYYPKRYSVDDGAALGLVKQLLAEGKITAFYLEIGAASNPNHWTAVLSLPDHLIEQGSAETSAKAMALAAAKLFCVPMRLSFEPTEGQQP